MGYFEDTPVAESFAEHDKQMWEYTWTNVIYGGILTGIIYYVIKY